MALEGLTSTGLNGVLSYLNGLMEGVRVPIIPIPAMILAMATIFKPGMSPLETSSRIITRQQEFGAPVGDNTDGTPNLMNELISVIVEEVLNEIMNNGVIEGVIQPFGLQATGFGANAGGPIVVQVTNTMPIKVYGNQR